LERSREITIIGSVGILQVRNWHSGSRRMSKLLGTSDEEKKKKKKKQQPE
jgi:hypothetical protein